MQREIQAVYIFSAGYDFSVAPGFHGAFLIFDQNYGNFSAGFLFELGQEFFQIGNGVNPVIIDGVPAGRQFASFIPIAERQSGDAQEFRGFFYGEESFFHGFGFALLSIAIMIL